MKAKEYREAHETLAPGFALAWAVIEAREPVENAVDVFLLSANHCGG